LLTSCSSQHDTAAHERKLRRAANGRLGAADRKKAKELRNVIGGLQDEIVEIKECVAVKTFDLNFVKCDLNFVKGQLANEKMRRNEAVVSSKRYKMDAEALRLAAEIARRDQAATL
jgi:hypothetical protein